MDEENAQKQLDELEALSAIYENEWLSDGQNSYKIQINKNVTMFITLNPLYPMASPPSYELLAPLLTKEQKSQISQALEDIYLENIGESVLYQWIEKVKEFLSSDHTDINDCCVDDEESTKNADAVNECSFDQLNEKIADEKIRGVFHGPTIVDRKSVFQGHVSKVINETDIKDVLQILLANKKISQATHNIYAYMIKNANGTILQDCEDDGETHAGARLLHLLNILKVENVIVVVSRWYGGVHLGPDRFRHINNAARQALQESGYIKSKQ